VFSIAELRATDLEYSIRSSPWWIAMLLLLIFLVPMTMFLTVLFPSWNELRRNIAIHAGETKAKVIGVLHWHPHIKRHA
jgi:hypothetical protein